MTMRMRMLMRMMITDEDKNDDEDEKDDEDMRIRMMMSMKTMTRMSIMVMITTQASWPRELRPQRPGDGVRLLLLQRRAGQVLQARVPDGGPAEAGQPGQTVPEPDQYR